MKPINICICLLATACLLFASCRTRPQLPPDEYRTDSVIVETLIPYMLPADSASIRALLRCNEHGRVVLQWLDAANGKNTSMSLRLDSLGNLLAKAKHTPDTVFIPGKTVSVNRVIKQGYPVNVPADIKWYETFLIYFGGFCLIILLGWIIIRMIRKKL